MKTKLETVIVKLAEKASDCSSDEVLKYTQSALNLAHVVATIGANGREEKRVKAD